MLHARRSTLVGRDQDVTAVQDLALHSDGRLVTLTGVGGVGKTTLAFEVARTVLTRMPDGVRTIELATLPDTADRDRVVIAVLRGLGLAEQARPVIDVLVEHLEPRQALLILDNCEHVGAPVGDLVNRLLDACPYVRVLATSRAPLKVRGETVYPVPPLAIPEATPSPSVMRLAGVPAVELFLLRARAADPGFRLDDANASAVRGICRRLDGIPLAIELAAARVSGMAPAEIERRLGPGERLLATDIIETPERQQTLQAALDWSYRLLRPAEQALFRRLSIFAGGWTLAAAEAICMPDGDPAGVAASMTSLVEQSFVIRVHDTGSGRYRFLQPIADFAAQRLDEAGEREALVIPHAEYFLALAGQRKPGTTQASADELDAIESDYANCLAGIRFAEAAGIAPLALGYAAVMTGSWRIRGYLQDGSEHLERALALAGPEPSFHRELMLLVWADIERLLGDYDAATRHADAGFAVAASLDEPAGKRTALAIHGDIAAARGDYEAARARYDEAWPFVEALPHPLATGYWQANVGYICLREGKVDEAGSHLESALASLAETEHTWYTGRVHCWLGAVERLRGRPSRARDHLTRGFEELVRYGARVDAIAGVEELARVALDQHDPARAAVLLAAASALRDSTALPPDETDRAAVNDDVERARDALGPVRFTTAWNHGREMSFERVADLASTPSVHPPSTSDDRQPPRGSQLTRREREVAELIGQGLTNPQIAERLFISPGTVRGHVEQILGKLGQTSRVQVATWVVADRGAKPVI